MNTDRRSECYNMLADFGFAGRDVTSPEIKMELACTIKWDSTEEFQKAYDWCLAKFFE